MVCGVAGSFVAALLPWRNFRPRGKMASRSTMIYFIFAFVFVLLAYTASAIRVPSNHLRDLTNGEPIQEERKGLDWLLNQQPIMKDTALNTVATPPTKSPSEDVDSLQDSRKGHPIVSDVLPKSRAISIFASLTRNFEPIDSRLNDASQNVTVLAPRNAAIQGLPRKPWENPEEYGQYGPEAYEGQGGQDRAQKNLKRFVEAHLIPVSPWKKDEEVATLGGGKLKWTGDGEKIFIQPGNVEVDAIAEQVSNGEVWILNGVVNYK